MADYQAPVDDLKFILFSVLKVQEAWPKLASIADTDMDTAKAIMDEAAKLCEQVVAPLNRQGDEEGCTLKKGAVVTPSGYKEAYQTFNDGAWGALGGNPEFGGMGLPKSLVATVEEMLQGACMSFGLAPMLTAGACLALEAHGSDQLKNTYLGNMISGRWSGSMDLTEPQAGTDLGLIRSKAEPQQDGSFRITGNKIFITWGEHDMAENIVHLVLARTPDAPPGIKGISMFLVPKYIANADGSLGERNALECGALEAKMGIKGSATCAMNFDGAVGWLVGQLHQGVACMFTMMNYERLTVGIQALASAHWSYTNALDYARNRDQGRGPYAETENPTANLLAHADVRRMLLTCKAYNEGGRAFYLYVAHWLDVAKFTTDEEQKRTAQNRIALLTPVAKAFLTDMAFECAVTGQQVFGGHGYIREWGQEQFVRDIRITQIYEGTNGVQAMDLVGRKTFACSGALLDDFLLEIDTFLAAESGECIEALKTGIFGDSLNVLRNVTQGILENGKRDQGELGAVATDYLQLLGHVCLGYMWLKTNQSIRSELENGSMDEDFVHSKRITCQYYFERIMPKIYGLSKSITGGAAALSQMAPKHW